MKCFSLLIGARNTPSGGDQFDQKEEEQIRAITFRHFPRGFTILNADGGWFDPQLGKFVAEESRQILVTTDRRASLRPWCDELGTALRQKELLVVELGPVRTMRPRPSRTRSKARPRGGPRGR
jgi:hypothetical protein